jgi:hypothetical protein
LLLKRSKNARLRFKQSLSHSGYFLFVFNLLTHYGSSFLHLNINLRAGTKTYGLQFFTRSLTCFTELHNLFYVNKIKIIPHNIYDLLTPVALAHLIMGDCDARSHGLIICTNNYSIEEVFRLLNVLIIRYELDCTLRLKKQNQKIEYLIYIRQRSMSLLRSIITPYFHTSMLYKLN